MRDVQLSRVVAPAEESLIELLNYAHFNSPDRVITGLSSSTSHLNKPAVNKPSLPPHLNHAPFVSDDESSSCDENTAPAPPPPPPLHTPLLSLLPPHPSHLSPSSPLDEYFLNRSSAPTHLPRWPPPAIGLKRTTHPTNSPTSECKSPVSECFTDLWGDDGQNAVRLFGVAGDVEDTAVLLDSAEIRKAMETVELPVKTRGGKAAAKTLHTNSNLNKVVKTTKETRDTTREGLTGRKKVKESKDEESVAVKESKEWRKGIRGGAVRIAATVDSTPLPKQLNGFVVKESSEVRSLMPRPMTPPTATVENVVERGERDAVVAKHHPAMKAATPKAATPKVKSKKAEMSEEKQTEEKRKKKRVVKTVKTDRVAAFHKLEKERKCLRRLCV